MPNQHNQDVQIPVSRPDTVIWDWNGTLLDDKQICLRGINRLLERRKLAPLDMDRYRKIFTFPVRSYYEAAGFDFSREEFEVPAEEFIDEYRLLLPEAGLFPDVLQVLAFFRQRGIRQYVLSAMEQQALVRSIDERGILANFQGIYGIGDNLAYSKLLRGRELLQENQIDPKHALMIGDTLHDLEVAGELGLNIVLVGRGHQHPDRLFRQGQTVLENLEQLKRWYNGPD
jgi:phosphoglycolate phosphatase